MGDRSDKSDSAVRTILIAVVIALLAGGSAPWWWGKVFPGSVSQNPQTLANSESGSSHSGSPSPTHETKRDRPSPAPTPYMGKLEMATNRDGHDISNFSVDDAEECSRTCEADSRCKAMTFVKHPSEPGGICWLKDGVPPISSNPAMISAVKKFN